MHKFTNYDLSFLKGSELTQIILVTRYAVTFVFTDLTQITVEHGFEYIRRRDNRVFSYHLQKGIEPVYFHELMEHRIEQVEVADYDLWLTFDNGDVLNIKSDDGRFEAGQIQKPGTYIVF
jgi:hypothetical protein